MTFARSARIAPIQVLSDQLRILLHSADSPAAMSAMLVDVPPGGGVPPHAHAQEEEGYFILDGALDLTVGAVTETLGAGDFGHVPPRTPHGYANRGDAPVRFLAWTVGGPVDRFFEDMSREVTQMPRDAARMADLVERYGITMLAEAPQ